ncbi:MAG: putative esterase of the alpha-beta hydrolase superfamily [Firmicutes bacterium]|nr:putative esterase of the alpha-beta hydrolase superfamily [Bacillota bacterium]
MILNCNAVFEGGGVKGIAIAGAVLAMQKAGYTFENMAGTSAGAIVAALLAVGYSGAEIYEILRTINYKDFRDSTYLFGLPGKIFSLSLHYGLYQGDYFTHWLDTLLKAKSKTTFGDIKQENPAIDKYTYKFQAIASDISAKKLLVLPGDLKNFGLDPDTFSISHAVRMSMSIPLIFVPFRLTDTSGEEHLIVDGGVLSNYPIWLLDDGTIDPLQPTFGFKLLECNDPLAAQCRQHQIQSLLDYLKNLLTTMLDAHDNYHIAHTKGDFERTIAIPTTINLHGELKNISAIDFDISPEESTALFNNGLSAANAFLEHWDFSVWKNNHRELLRNRFTISPPATLHPRPGSHYIR